MSFWKGTFVSLESMGFDPEIDEIRVWSNEPGGKVVDRFTSDDVDYVYVVFENSPGRKYLYRAGD